MSMQMESNIFSVRFKSLLLQKESTKLTYCHP